jgi:hypothetical protein
MSTATSTCTLVFGLIDWLLSQYRCDRHFGKLGGTMTMMNLIPIVLGQPSGFSWTGLSRSNHAP